MFDAYKLKTPASLMLSGPSGAGKSTLIQEIIQRLPEVFDRPPTSVVFCYARNQYLYDDIKKHCPVPIQFIKGLPESLRPAPRSLIIFDDLQSEFGPLITSYFVAHSHHSDCDILSVAHNLFEKGSYHRTCSLNTHALCVFKNPRDKALLSKFLNFF